MKNKFKFIIIASLILPFLIGCQKTKTSIPSTNSLSPHEISGLSVDLPFALSKENIELPAAVKAQLKSFTVHSRGEQGLQIMVTHAVTNGSDASLDGATNGAINEVQAMPGVSTLSKTIEPTRVSGLEGRNITLKLKNSGHSVLQYMLIFVRGKEMWQIQMIAEESGNNAQTEELKNKIFTSVKVKSE